MSILAEIDPFVVIFSDQIRRTFDLSTILRVGFGLDTVA